MLHIIFYGPQIPGNTGSAIRLSACTGARLHLVEPIGFSLEDKDFKRVGLDYHDKAYLTVHPDFDSVVAEIPGRIWAFTGHTDRLYHTVEYADGDALLFGPEPDGLPEKILQDPRLAGLVRIPMKPSLRSLNLAVSAAVGLYYAWGQLGYPGGE